MKIAITAKGDALESPVDPRFGRAQRFVLFDTETGGFVAIDNRQNLEAAQGAGIQAARNVIEAGAEMVITGHCGPKAFRTLSAAGIKVIVGSEGTVAETLEKFKAGKLAPAKEADVEGHWV